MPLSPEQSRIVEAVCILLCQKYPDAQTSSGRGKANGHTFQSETLCM